MANLTIPNPEAELGKVPNGDPVRINNVWYQKLSEWLKRTNQLSANGELTITATSDTNLRFSYRGSDGVTRVADLTLA